MFSADEFLSREDKSLTLLGMSGVGKTVLSSKLEQWGWYAYSCDLQIGKKYLEEEILGTLHVTENTITADDLSLLSRYVGQIGDAALGGLDLEEFKRRQRLYISAETAALRAVGNAMQRAYADGFRNFVNDSTGSLCEIEDESLITQIASQSLLVYIEAGAADKREILQRAEDYPKPLYFPPALFDNWLDRYMQEHEISEIRKIKPNDFSRWVFPLLYESRLPKYERIAAMYGITIPSKALADVGSQEDFLHIVADHIHE